MATEGKGVYYVYFLVDPRTENSIFHVPFYIGKGKNKRAYDHLLKGCTAGENRHKKHKIEKIREHGVEPEIHIIKANLTEENAYYLETLLIQFFGRINIDETGILTNICVDNRPPNFKGKTYEEIYGVEKSLKLKESRRISSRDRIVSEETRNRMSLAKKGKPNIAMRGRQRSEEHRRKISECMKGRYSGDKNPFFGKTHSAESKAKRLATYKKNGNVVWNKGKKMSEEIRIKNGWATKVQNIDTGEIFYSINKAKEFYTGDISACARGQQKTAGGYRWKQIKE